MDGPNVNWKTFELLNARIDGEVRHQLLNSGSCGLHTIHNAFRSGWPELSWDIQHAFSSLYWLFKDGPAWREDYTQLTGSGLFAKRFCQTQWVGNAEVASRALEMWPHVEQYVTAVQTR